MSNDDEIHKELVELVEHTLAQDQALRTKYGIGDKFRFIRDRLQALLTHLQKSITRQITDEKNETTIREDEITVYIYLFNAQGSVLANWLNMLTPNAILEYSVNRPIYSEKAAISNLIHQKANQAQHAYITIPVSKTAILTETVADNLDGKVIKLVERSLDPSRMIAFTHTDIDYQLTDERQLIKKS